MRKILAVLLLLNAACATFYYANVKSPVINVRFRTVKIMKIETPEAKRAYILKQRLYYLICKALMEKNAQIKENPAAFKPLQTKEKEIVENLLKKVIPFDIFKKEKEEGAFPEDADLGVKIVVTNVETGAGGPGPWIEGYIYWIDSSGNIEAITEFAGFTKAIYNKLLSVLQ